MIWLYWHRWRSAVLAVAVSLGTLAALVIVAGSIAGDPVGTARGSVVSHGGTTLRRATAGVTISPGRARLGLAWMNAAVVACQNVTYRGVQMIAWMGRTGNSAYTISIWHQAGGTTVSRNDADSDSDDQALNPRAAASQDSEGVLTVTAAGLYQMRRHYLIESGGTGTAAGRPARIVLAQRKDGSVAARYWLDMVTSLPLRREVYDASGHLVNEGAFIDLELGTAATGSPSASVPPWNLLLTSRDVAGLRAAGWPVPLQLADNLTLVSAARTATPDGAVVDASYSDGLSVVSLFLQRGQLPDAPPGWLSVAIQGQPVYASQADDRSVAWSARGFVYTVIADAPPDTVTRIVAALPHDDRPGFWQRVGRGLKKMTSWLDPFR